MALAGGRVQHGREEVGGALFGIFLRLCSLVCVDRGVRSRHGVVHSGEVRRGEHVEIATKLTSKQANSLNNLLLLCLLALLPDYLQVYGFLRIVKQTEIGTSGWR